MKLLVTGGAGFIGSALIRRAVADGLAKTYEWIYDEVKRSLS